MGMNKRNTIRTTVLIALIAIFSAGFSYLLTNLQPFRTLELKWIDLMFDIRGQASIEDSPIVLVAISEQSDFELPEKFPWPTSYYARLIDNLNEAGAAVIGIDVIFDKNDIYDAANDTLFANALARHGNVVLAGNVMREVQRATNVELRSAFDGQQLVQPIRLLNESNPNRWGFVSVNRDLDGFLRRYPLELRHFEEIYYSLGVEVLKVYKGLQDEDISNEEGVFRLGDLRLPKWDNRNIYINYAGLPGSFPEYNFSDVIDTEDFFTLIEDEGFQINAFDDPEFGLLHQDVFRDKIVLVGATMPELHDFYPAPFAPNGNMPGYETHANGIHTILSGQFITRPTLQTVLYVILGVALLITITTMLSSVKWGVFFLMVQLSGYVSIVLWLFLEQRFIIELIGPSLTIIIGYSTSVVYGYFNEHREKKRIQSMFGSYVAPEVVDRMIASGEEPRLGGERMHITAFFSDIQNFSTFSEKLSAEELVELMNEYLGAMTDILIEEGGTLDKYIGDAIVAFFGAPIPSQDHAYRACVTSQKMLLKQHELCIKWRQEGKKWPRIVSRMQTRIGLNTGEVITGNMGSRTRFNYTMMGDNVNLAARCESAAKAYGVYTMVTGETRSEAEAVGDACLFRKLDRIIVKGRTLPVEVHEVVGLRTHLKNRDLECVTHFEAGLESYFMQNWEAAEKSFRLAAELERSKPNVELKIETNPSLVLLERVAQMRENPPDANWDGVYVMKSK